MLSLIGSPSLFHALFVAFIGFVALQWFVTAVNLTSTERLAYPYDLLNAFGNKTDTFGDRDWGCNDFQAMSAGVSKKAGPNPMRHVQATVYLLVTFSALAFSAMALRPSSLTGTWYKRAAFWTLLVILFVGSANLLYSSLSQMSFLGSAEPKAYKHVSFDYVGTLTQVASLPDKFSEREGVGARVWDAQATLNFIFGSVSLVLIVLVASRAIRGGLSSATLEDLFTAGPKQPPGMRGLRQPGQQQQPQATGGRPVAAASLLAFTEVGYLALAGIVLIAAMRGSFSGYPRDDSGMCSATQRNLPVKSTTPAANAKARRQAPAPRRQSRSFNPFRPHRLSRSSRRRRM